MEILKTSEKSEKEIVDAALNTLKKGGLIVYPTETCYGVGVVATNKSAVEKLLEYKSRREGKPLSIAVANKEMAGNFVEINEVAQNLYENYLPGPVTVISNSYGSLPDGVESEFGTIGIRIPDYPLILKIIKKLGEPITATSANMSYGPRPYSIESLLENLPKKQQSLIDLIIDAGKLPLNEPSTVVDTTLNNLNIMREGAKRFEKEVEGKKPVLDAVTKTPDETVRFGGINMLKYINDLQTRGVLFLLSGELGTGKTQFTKGVAKQLKINDLVKSPTFILMSEYEYNLGESTGMLIHIDFWKLDNYSHLKIDKYLKKKNVVIVEWADKFMNSLLDDARKKGVRVINVVGSYVDQHIREFSTYEI
ncbi:MAG TPA: threonylcarbamoyl-AMP synthase [bacterium]|nr:threonylcarbamoyl-AMP synthase [bacterium]